VCHATILPRSKDETRSRVTARILFGGCITPNMDLNTFSVITAGVLVTLAVVLRLFAPALYYKYFLRGAAQPATSSSEKSSRAVAAAMLVGIILSVSHFFFRRLQHKPLAPYIAVTHSVPMRVGAWTGFGVCFDHRPPPLAISCGCHN
jgi:hypothetical protein